MKWAVWIMVVGACAAPISGERAGDEEKWGLCDWGLYPGDCTDTYPIEVHGVWGAYRPRSVSFCGVNIQGQDGWNEVDVSIQCYEPGGVQMPYRGELEWVELDNPHFEGSVSRADGVSLDAAISYLPAEGEHPARLQLAWARPLRGEDGMDAALTETPTFRRLSEEERTGFYQFVGGERLYTERQPLGPDETLAWSCTSSMETILAGVYNVELACTNDQGIQLTASGDVQHIADRLLYGWFHGERNHDPIKLNVQVTRSAEGSSFNLELSEDSPSNDPFVLMLFDMKPSS